MHCKGISAMAKNNAYNENSTLNSIETNCPRQGDEKSVIFPTAAYADTLGMCAMLEAELEISRSVHGDKYLATLVIRSELGITLVNQGLNKEACKLMESTVKDCRRVLGKNHYETLVAMETFAHALAQEGDLTRATLLVSKVLKRRCLILGEDHADTLQTKTSLGALLFAMGDLAGARELEEAVLKSCQDNLGDAHEETIAAKGNLSQTLQNMAVALRNDGNLEEAEPLQIKVIEMMTTVYGEDSINAAFAYSAYGAILKLKGKTEEAIYYFKKAIEIRERELGADSDSTQLVKSRLLEILQ
jgi:tetratricopeptide (TPR) repeat protein